MSSLYQSFLDRVQMNPSAPAVSHASATRAITSYGELRALAERYAVGLSVSAPSGVPVPLYINKSAESIACLLACLASGRPFAWLNKRLRWTQIEDVISASRAESIVTDAPGLLALRSALESDCRLADIRWLALSDTTPLGRPASLAQAIRRMPGSLQVAVLESDGKGMLTGIDADRMGCCLFTSGSTGRQRGVMVAEGDLTARARTEVDWYSLSAGDRLMSVLPFSFDVGLNQLMSGLLAGACIVIQDSWLPRDLIGTLARERITGISGVPAIWRDLMASGSPLASDRRHSLRYITVSGGSLSRTEQDRLLAIAPGVQVFKTYGQTETFRSSSLRPDELCGREESVGRAYPGTRVVVVRDDGTECSPGELGEIVHVGDGTMLGYLDETSSDAKLRNLPADLGGGRGVFTGDNGYLDRDGFLYLKGRRDSMVKIAGNRIYPEEVAGQLRALDGVKEAEVVAVSEASPDPRLIGFAVLARESAWTPDAVRRAISQRLPSHMVPAVIVVLPAIPRLANGKPDRLTLTTLFPDESSAAG